MRYEAARHRRMTPMNEKCLDTIVKEIHFSSFCMKILNVYVISKIMRTLC